MKTRRQFAALPKRELGESGMIGMCVQWQSGLETFSGTRQASQTFKFLAYE